jgi:hypothetical protein
MDTVPLPPAVLALAERLGVSGKAGSSVALTQSGRMRNDARSRWMPFTAQQMISLTECEFDWRARTGPAGLVSVVDRFGGGEGALEVKALGFIPLARVAGTPDVARGELMRYLAELPWAPAAILLNRHLAWRELPDGRLIVSASTPATTAEIELALDANGRIATAFAPDRPRAVKQGFVALPWRGRFSDYRQVGGIWIPFAGEVSWEADQGEAGWQGRIESWVMG